MQNTKTNYQDLLKDPRWQRKRLEVMNRDNFTCTKCGDDKTTLNVHHLQYCGAPWEVDSSLLVTLCEVCHLAIEKYKGSVIRKIEKKPYPDFVALYIYCNDGVILSYYENREIYTWVGLGPESLDHIYHESKKHFVHG